MPVLALAETPSLHQQGVDAFRAGQYEQALEYFQQIEADGSQSPTLYYNLGSTYYMLGQYMQAENAFKRLQHDPVWQGLALYNLGLIAEAREDPDAAEEYYARAFQEAGDQSRVKPLSARKLESLRQERANRAAARRWRGYLSAAAGYDDNPALIADNVFENVREKGDLFADISAFGNRYITGDYHDGVNLRGGAYARLYADAYDFNAATVFAGASRQKQYDKWHTGAGVDIKAGIIDDQYYATTPALQLTVRRYVDGFEIKLDNETGWIQATDTYDHLTGIRSRLTAAVIRRMANADIFAGYTFEYNNRDDLRSNGDFFSYSPLRNTLYAEVDWFVTPEWTLTVGGEYRKSRYADANRWFVNGSAVRQKREDDRVMATIRGERDITENMTLFAGYSYTDNDSNLFGYSYRSNQVLLGINRFF